MKTTHPMQILALFCLLLTSGLTFQAQAAASGGKTTPAPRCLVAEIRGIAFTIHHPNDRYLAITEWLNKTGLLARSKSCSTSTATGPIGLAIQTHPPWDKSWIN